MKLLNYYKQLKWELLHNLKYNKTLLEVYNYNRDLQQVRKILSENIQTYKDLKNANTFIKNWKPQEVKKYEFKQTIQSDEDEYDNMEESNKRKNFIKEYELINNL